MTPPPEIPSQPQEVWQPPQTFNGYTSEDIEMRRSFDPSRELRQRYVGEVMNALCALGNMNLDRFEHSPMAQSTVIGVSGEVIDNMENILNQAGIETVVEREEGSSNAILYASHHSSRPDEMFDDEAGICLIEANIPIAQVTQADQYVFINNPNLDIVDISGPVIAAITHALLATER